ncbi:MAG: hypothetical protein OEY64_01505 [Nitrospinota bacterium]|nr:hypothetical protein [Nitrospinota bacterium]
MKFSAGSFIHRSFSLIAVLAIPFLVITLSSCGSAVEKPASDTIPATEETSGNTNPDTNSSTDTATTEEKTVSGYAILGPVFSATVDIYGLNDDGTRGDLIATTTTGSDGEFSYTGKIKGAIAIVVTGGSYTDEATGETVTLRDGDELVTLLAEGSDVQNVGVTALTTIASARASKNASHGLSTAIDAANKEVAVFFGLDGVDIVKVRPDDLTDDTEDDKDTHNATYGLVNAAFTQLAKDKGLTPQEVLDLLKMVSADYSDGGFDGKDHGKDLKDMFVNLNITPDQALADIGTAADNFLANDNGDTKRNHSGIKKDEKKIVPGKRPKEPETDDNSTSTDTASGTDTTTSTDTATN